MYAGIPEMEKYVEKLNRVAESRKGSPELAKKAEMINTFINNIKNKKENIPADKSSK
jgi:hypothetical protein